MGNSGSRMGRIGEKIVAGWLILTLAVSFRFRRRIGQRRWRLLHYSSFVAFTAGLWHALNVGSDLVGTRGLAFAAVAITPVLWLIFVRILTPRTTNKPPPGRKAAPPPVAVAEPQPRQPVSV